MAGDAALGAGGEPVTQPDVGERPTDHHLVVAASGAVGVEVLRVHPVLDEVTARRRVGLDGSGGRDVVGGHRVAEQGQHPGVDDVRARRRLRRHPLEIRRMADVGRVRCPAEGLGHRAAVTGRQGLPPFVTAEIAVVLGEHLRADRVAHHGGHLGLARPDVTQIDRAARGVGAQRVVEQVDVHRAGKGVGDDERRGRQVVHLDVRVDPALEVAVTGQHADHRQVTGGHPLADLLR